MSQTKSKTAGFSGKYIEAVGRRKTSIARVRLFADHSGIVVNERDFKEYFPTSEMQKIVQDAFEKSQPGVKFGVSVKVHGGGTHSQSEAVRHGIARALNIYDVALRHSLKKAGYLKRDPRMKERRKFGLKKARRAPQWSKR